MALIVVFVNESNLADVSDYRCEVSVGDGSAERSHIIHRTHILGHTRADGWRPLVQRLLDQVDAEPES